MEAAADDVELAGVGEPDAVDEIKQSDEQSDEIIVCSDAKNADKNADDPWPIEDVEWWETTGEAIGWRNLYVSIPILLMGFATWAMWSMIVVKMKKTGYSFGEKNLSAEQRGAYCYTITATAGMCGATYRLVHSFMVRVGGGRNVNVLTNALLLVPTMSAGILLCNPDVHIYWWIFFASFAGFGGGNFSSSMSNISNFFPKREIGTALGLNAGLGNVGVFTALLLVSIASSWNVGFSNGRILTAKDVTLGGSLNVGDRLYPESGAFVWVPFLILLTILAWYYMTNLEHVSPGSTTDQCGAYMRILTLVVFAFPGDAIGIVAAIISLEGGWWVILPFMVLPAVIFVPVHLLKTFAPESIKADIMEQFSIFDNKHTWIMSTLYTMTFGSFIGFSFAFGLLIIDLFGHLPNAPSAAIYAPWGPLLGALIRPFGGWLADKVGSGSRVTAYSTALTIVSTASVAISITSAKTAANPLDYFPMFYISFMLVFVATGIGNGSTFRSVPYIFDKAQKGPVLGWISAIAAYGSFVIPQLFKATIANGSAEIACWIFMAYYVFCLVLNWYYYDRADSGISC